MGNSMNDNFKELLPNPFAVDYTTYDEPMDLYREQELEKFAELIVKECVSTLYQHGWTDAANDMKEHFGVEQ